MMNADLRERLQRLTLRYKELGIANQIDYDKFYLYSLVAHSTAIEGSTVTEIEAQLLFDEGITSSKRTWIEQMMNIDLKNAYLYGKQQINQKVVITPDWLCKMSAKVMEHTGNLKVPSKLEDFCKELNRRRNAKEISDVATAYELSFWAHYELVTIHPWADGNGRVARLLMNLLQMEQDLLPVKVMSNDKADYIQALIDTRDADNIDIFVNFMASLHCRNIEADIEQYISSTEQETSDKRAINQGASDKTSDKCQQVLDFVVAHPNCRTCDVALSIGLSQQRARHYIALLVAEGRLKAQGANKNRTFISSTR